MAIAIVDYGAGNLKSVSKALDYLGLTGRITAEPSALAAADGIILPGVGAFPDAMQRLRERGLDTALREQAAAGKPLLGICLGMQLLAEESSEVRPTPGLGLIPGRVDRIQTAEKLPQIGWNSLRLTHPNALTQDLRDGDYVYFVHSYMFYAGQEADVAAVTDYGATVTAMVARGAVFGCQFHPEKSGEVGLQILKRFGELAT